MIKITSNSSGGLRRETAFAVKHSTLAIIELVEYLLTKENIEFVLLGLIQSDYLQCRFGWFRQLNDGNYYAKVLQFLQAEKRFAEVSYRIWIQYVRN